MNQIERLKLVSQSCSDLEAKVKRITSGNVSHSRGNIQQALKSMQSILDDIILEN